MGLSFSTQSDFKLGALPSGREIRFDLWSVEDFVASGWQYAPNIIEFGIFSKAVKLLSNNCTVSVWEHAHYDFSLFSDIHANIKELAAEGGTVGKPESSKRYIQHNQSWREIDDRMQGTITVSCKLSEIVHKLVTNQPFPHAKTFLQSVFKVAAIPV